MKTLCFISFVFYSYVSASESNYKIRLHKSLVKEIMDKNFPVALKHIESKVSKNVFLTEINANIDNIVKRMEFLEFHNHITQVLQQLKQLNNEKKHLFYL